MCKLGAFEPVSETREAAVPERGNRSGCWDETRTKPPALPRRPRPTPEVGPGEVQAELEVGVHVVPEARHVAHELPHVALQLRVEPAPGRLGPRHVSRLPGTKYPRGGGGGAVGWHSFSREFSPPLHSALETALARVRAPRRVVWERLRLLSR